MEELEGKGAIITGGARGIGKATAELFIQAGARVYIWDIDTAGETVAEKMGAVFQKVDTTNRQQIEDAVDELKKQNLPIDILINNAGITRDASLKKMTPDQWQQVIDVNLTGVFNSTQIVSRVMVEQRYGRICNASSVVGLYGNFGQTNYVAAKAGLIGMTKTWARELGRKGITVNAVAPGFIATDMLDSVPDTYLDELKQKTPLQRLGHAEDIAEAYLFLASDRASFITGQVLQVDGGLVV